MLTPGRRLGAIVIAVLVLGCGSGTPSPNVSLTDAAVPSTTLPYPPGFLGGIAWLRDDRIVFSESSLGPGTQLFSIHTDGSGSGPLTIDLGFSCTRLELLSPVRLTGGDLSYQVRCSPGARGPFTYRTGLMAVDAAGRSRVLMPLTDVPFIPRQAAWSPDASQGFLDGGSVICEGIVRVDGSGIRPWDLRLGSGSATFNLADFLAPSDDCAATGNADTPAWSPDNRVAFFGSTAAVGKGGQSRLDVPWALYAVDAGLATPTILLDGLDDPRGLSWSPDGRWLAMAGAVSGTRGAWLFEVATRRLVRVSSQPTWIDLAWSPDGSRLAGVSDATQPGADRTATIVILDVSAVVSAK